MKLIKQAEEAATKKRIKQLLREGKAKYCPTCKYLIEKNGGCDHMRCTNCSTTFDWEREELTSNWMGILSLSHQRAISYRNYIMLRFS